LVCASAYLVLEIASRGDKTMQLFWHFLRLFWHSLLPQLFRSPHKKMKPSFLQSTAAVLVLVRLHSTCCPVLSLLVFFKKSYLFLAGFELTTHQLQSPQWQLETIPVGHGASQGTFIVSVK
jgi:hypothetical protein